MRSTFKVLFYVNGSKEKNGIVPIMGRVTINGSVAQFSCKLTIAKTMWDAKGNRAKGKSKESRDINLALDNIKAQIIKHYQRISDREAFVTAEMVRNAYQGIGTEYETLLGAFDKDNESFKKRIGIDRAKSTYPGYHYMRLALGEFIKHQYKVKDLAFGQLTEQFIHDYQTFVTEDKGQAIDTARHYLAILKKICRIAYKEGHADKIHFQHFTLPRKTETTPRALSRESFEKIRDVEIPAYRKSHMLARDMFLFGCYTGVSYADVVSITHANLQTDGDGALWLKYRRKKNELRASVKLLPEAIALINKYSSEDRETLFPLLRWPNLRRHMKALAALAGIKDDLCYHQARHSFASLITLEAGVPIETISRMLGHSDISTTQVYARVSPKKLFEDMDRFIKATEDFKLTL